MAWEFDRLAEPPYRERGFWWVRPVFANPETGGEECVPLKFQEAPSGAELLALRARILERLNAVPRKARFEQLMDRLVAFEAQYRASMNATVRAAIQAIIADRYED